MGQANREAAWLAIKNDSKLSVGAAFLLAYLGDLISDDGDALTAGCKFIAGDTVRPVSSVRRWRAELVESGYLQPLFVGKGGDKANSYRFTPTPSTYGGVHPRTPGGPPTDPKGGPRGVQEGSTHGPKQEQEQKKEERSDIDPDFYRWAVERARGKGGGTGLVKKIVAEDGAIYEAERAEAAKRDRSRQAADAVAACGQCDSSGFTEAPDDTGIPRMIRCRHEEAA